MPGALAFDPTKQAGPTRGIVPPWMGLEGHGGIAAMKRAASVPQRPMPTTLAPGGNRSTPVEMPAPSWLTGSPQTPGAPSWVTQMGGGKMPAQMAAQMGPPMNRSTLPVPAGGLASMGRNGDTMLAHINPDEAALLKARGGSGTINPATGLREFWENSRGGYGSSDSISGGNGSNYGFAAGGGSSTIDHDRDLGFSGGGSDRGAVTAQEEPSMWNRALWGIGATILGGPVLGALAGYAGPAIMDYFSGLSEPAQAAGAQAIQQNLAGQRHITADDYREAAQVGTDAARQRELSRGTDQGSIQPNGQFQRPGGVAPVGGGIGTVTQPTGPGPTVRPTGPAARPAAPPRRTIAFDGDMTTYGQRPNNAETTWFNRFF